MDAFTGPERRRRTMNLGGVAPVSQREVLEQAKASRLARQEERRRQEAAIKIQAHWRGVIARRRLYPVLREKIRQDFDGLSAMKCLALLPDSDEALGEWSKAMCVQEDPFALSRSLEQKIWLSLMRRIEVKLLVSVSGSPSSLNAVYGARIINLLYTKLGDPTLTNALLSHLLEHGYYNRLGKALSSLGIEAKKSPILPPLASLITIPFATSHEASEIYKSCLLQCIRDILTLPLLPNRLPITSLTELSSRLPFSSLNLVEEEIPDIIQPLDSSQKAYLLSNFAAFMPPRYASLKASSMDAYLHLLTSLLSYLPPGALEAPTAPSVSLDTSLPEDDEDVQMLESGETDNNNATSNTISVDNKTRTRLDTFTQPGHIQSLLSASAKHTSIKSNLYAFLLLLWNVWPARKDKVISTILSSSGDGFIRELYRLYVRSSPIGKTDDLKALKDAALTKHWPAFLCLTEMYTRLLITMGDDEFFASTSATTSSQRTQANPLTIGEVTSFSRQAMNVTIALYLGVGVSEKDKSAMEYCIPGINVSFDEVRLQVTKLVQGIHARDSRRPFSPPNHWLFGTQQDLRSFVAAAVMEEQEMSEPSERASSKSRRDFSHLTPRLAVLKNIPFAIPFNARVEAFRQFVRMDMARHDRDDFGYSRTKAVIRRTNVAGDGFDKLGSINLKGDVRIIFIDQFGEEEAGIDGGGLFKEFFTSLCKEVFDTNRGLWLATSNNELYPNPSAYAKEAHSLEWYRFIGRVLGKAMYEGILVDVAFAGFFLAKWLGKSSFLDDLASLDNELYKGLIFLKHYTGNCEDLSLTFCLNEEEFGVSKDVDLIPNGRDIAVTNENRLQYILLVCHYKLTKQIRQQSTAFFEGLSEMIEPNWLRMFNQQELQILIGGVNTPIDPEDLRKNTIYGGAYNNDNPSIQMFWKVVDTFPQKDLQALLRFTTSCSRPPLLGFGELNPKFSIAPNTDDQSRLPTASTCVNLLKLPMYKNESVLKQKVLQAINSGAGFNMS